MYKKEYPIFKDYFNKTVNDGNEINKYVTGCCVMWRELDKLLGDKAPSGNVDVDSFNNQIEPTLEPQFYKDAKKKEK